MSNLLNTAPFWIDPCDTRFAFPDVERALPEPDGLLAIGGDLSAQRLESAYRQGIFPWYSGNQPILWWSPDPRAVLYPEQIKISRSLAKTVRQQKFRVSFDKAFSEVIHACQQPRRDTDETWITPEMFNAYNHMHQLGHAHSVECWHEEQLVGGLYGLAYGKVFFGESMFSHQSNASKVALVHLVEKLSDWQFQLIDCQVSSPHISSLGAREIPRNQFIQHLHQWCAPNMDNHHEKWS